MGGFFSSSLGTAALVIIILVVVYFMSPKPKNIELDDTKSQDEQVAVSYVPTDTEEKVEKQNDMELVSSIMGALSVYLDMPASTLMIKSIKRVDGNNSVWRERGLKGY